MNDLVVKQKKYFFTNETRSIKFRLGQLQKLKQFIIANEQRIIEALYKDLKKPAVESYSSEINLVLDEINFATKNLELWSKPQNVPTSISLKPASAQITPEPYGVTLIIAPWNYPFQLTILPTVGALAAGNTVILKPSELAPHTERLLSEMITTHFDPQYLAIVNGGKEAAQELLREKFDFIFFTGSTQVGKLVMKAAAENLTPICLELGGKSPCIIDESASLEVAARRIVWGKFYNAGQTCIAPDFLYVHESIKSTFIGLLKKYIRNFYGENELKSPDYGKIISKEHFDRLSGLIDGAKILYGGDKNREEQFLSPTIVEANGWDDKTMKEEIFGPILPILSYKNLDDVIETLKTKEKPLALYIFSTDRKNIIKATSTLPYGGGCINDCLIQFSSRLPSGGVGASGIGKYHGKYSFDTFSHYKTVVEKSNLFDFELRYPPYTEKKLNIFKKILKI